MNKILKVKAIIKEQGWRRLFAIFKDKIYTLFERFLFFVFKLFPEKIQLNIKLNTKVVKKMDYQKSDVFLEIDSKNEYKSRIYSCRKEPETVKWIETVFKEGDVFYDIGANVGAYSLVASKFFGGKVKVYAFEPSFVTFTKLCRNIMINHAQDSIIPVQIALSDKTMVDIFNYSDMRPGSSSHALGEPINCYGSRFEPAFKQHILASRMDNLIKQFNLAAPNHIKIDVDGIEFKILKGLEETLLNPLVRSILLELREEGGANEMIDFLASRGFIIQSKHKADARSIDLPTSMYNYIFKRA